MPERTVLFVCLHGAAMSRMADAYFNRFAPPGWRGVSAGFDPGMASSATAAHPLADTPAADFLDTAPPRSVSAVPEPIRIIALRDEIRARAESLARTLASEPVPVS